MQAKMQTRVRCNGRIFLAVCIILFMGYTAQGVPVQKARFQRVRCRPDILSANCIEEKGPLFEISESGANRILPPKADPFLMKRFQEQPDIFSLYGEESGSGADDIPETESESGSGIDYNVEYPNLSSSGLVQKEELKQELTNEDLML
ncbi:serglycin [Pangshura tecta]|uniref:39S ribosomal protein L15, mitochondrial n=1 Tax=Platysternon megacephalum TaxID=55544 RepID=A0A4D9EXE0_9SAUR|nr:39S ribosomal protein L15, mitochondrial [Platysternon megacephalum]